MYFLLFIAAAAVCKYCDLLNFFYLSSSCNYTTIYDLKQMLIYERIGSIMADLRVFWENVYWHVDVWCVLVIDKRDASEEHEILHINAATLWRTNC